jgi:hypothetical protein
VGEDVLRKKTDQFQRLRGVQFTKLIERHLFSGSPAREAIETTGAIDRSHSSPATRCVTVPETRAHELRPLVEAGTSVGEVIRRSISATSRRRLPPGAHQRRLRSRPSTVGRRPRRVSDSPVQ